MDRKTLKAIEALVASGIVAAVVINRLHERRRLRLLRINRNIMLMETFAELDERIDTGLKFEEIIRREF